MAVNPINGDMFFHDKASHSIYVCDRNYSFVKELTSNVKLFSDIQRIALDLRHKWVFLWTQLISFFDILNLIKTFLFWNRTIYNLIIFLVKFTGPTQIRWKEKEL